MRIPIGFKETTLIKYPQLKEFYLRFGKPAFIEMEVLQNSARVIAKCEWDLPSETIKAKAALAMIWKLLDDFEGDVKDIVVLEYSGGGLSLALAELCNLLEIKCVLVLMEVTPKSILNRLAELNASVELTQKEKGFWGVVEHAQELKKLNPNWKFLYQHENWANYDFHYHVTANEIIESDVDSVDAWISSIGTGGTLAGVYNGLKNKFPQVELHTNMPSEMPYGTKEPPNSLPKFAGSGGLGYGRKQMFVERIESEIVQQHHVSIEDAKKMMLKVYLKTDLIIGSSSAANLVVAYQIAAKLGRGKTVLTVFPSKALPEEKEEILQKSLEQINLNQFL